MNKGILVMDQPDCCYECPCYVPSCDIDFDFDEDVCGATQNVTYGNASPDWCPIKPAPQKIKYKSRQDISKEQFAVGWNACVDEICKGEWNE